MGLEVLGEGDDVGDGLAEVGVEVPNLGGVGTQAGHEAGAGGGADGLLAVGAEEGGAGGGEFVDVGADDVFGSEAMEFGAEVIDGDEEDVGADFCRGK